MKKFLGIMLTTVLVFAFAGQAVAAKTTVASNAATVEGFAFHCNCDGGNGKTYIVGKAKDFGKKLNINLTRNANDPTVWDVVVPAGDVWECTTCGGTEWITFSNKSGVPDGKNIQLNHPAKAPVVEPTDPEPIDPEPIDLDPIEFIITVFHRVVDTGAYLVYPEIGETFASTDEAYIEWLNDVNGFTFLNLFLAANRNNDPASLSSVAGYECSFVAKDDVDDSSFDLTQVNSGESIEALINPVANGHYVITFWYEAEVL